MSCFVWVGRERKMTTIFHKIKLIKHFKMTLKMLWFVGISNENELEFSSFCAFMRTKMKEERLLNMFRTVGKLSIWRHFASRTRTKLFLTINIRLNSIWILTRLEGMKRTPKYIYKYSLIDIASLIIRASQTSTSITLSVWYHSILRRLLLPPTTFQPIY